MESAAMKIFAAVITSVMTFLGWDTSDYVHLLPETLQTEIPISVSSTSPILLPPLETVAEKPPAPKAKVIPAPLPKAVPQPKPIVQTPPQVTPVPPATVPTPATPPVVVKPVETPKVDTGTLTPEQKIRAATVNILCTMQTGNEIAHYTGSGVVIDASGIILTNAHVAEHILLEQAGRETCFIRTGSPASNSYKARVVYLPDAWIESNKFNLKSQSLTGNGENDYAILMLSSRVSASAPDVPLPHLVPDISDVAQGTTVTLAGYPLLSQSVSFLNSGLYSLTESSTINRVAGYNGGSSDVINTGPTNVAAHGTSGGAIVGSSGTLIGIIDAAVVDAYSGRSAVLGITLSYINRSLGQKGKSLKSLIENATSEADSFALNKVQYLSGML
jgi:hypothetical protein